MLLLATRFFCLIPSPSKKRILLPGVVIESDSTSFVGQFDDPIAPPVDCDVNAFCEVNGKFFQQGAAVARNSPRSGQRHRLPSIWRSRFRRKPPDLSRLGCERGISSPGIGKRSPLLFRCGHQPRRLRRRLFPIGLTLDRWCRSNSKPRDNTLDSPARVQIIEGTPRAANSAMDSWFPEITSRLARRCKLSAPKCSGCNSKDFAAPHISPFSRLCGCFS